jgi:molybdopterin synthase sulfur carrier subunit
MDGQNAAQTTPNAATGGMTVRFWAAARAATGVETASVSPGGLAGVIEVVATKYPELSALLPRCSFLLDGVAVSRDDVSSTLAPVGSTLEILPPFAGG